MSIMSFLINLILVYYSNNKTQQKILIFIANFFYRNLDIIVHSSEKIRPRINVFIKNFNFKS